MSDDTDIFAGLSRRECCSGCTPERCQISESWICLHPVRSQGLQASHTRDPALVDRFERAQELLLGSPASSVV
jgi:hypothetical protein